MYDTQLIFHWNGIAVGLMGLVENWLGLCPKVKPTEAKYVDIFTTAQQTCADLRRRGAEVTTA